MKEQPLSNNVFLRDVLGPALMRCVVTCFAVLYGFLFFHNIFSCVVVQLCEAIGESVAWRVVSRRAVACHLYGLKLSTLMTQETNQKDSPIHKHTHSHAYKQTHTHNPFLLIQGYANLLLQGSTGLFLWLYRDFSLRTEWFCLEDSPCDVHNDLCATV